MPASTVVCQDPDEPIRIPYEIHRKIYNLTNDEIQEYLNKEEEIKKKAEQAKLLEMTKTERIKDAEYQVHKRQHNEKAKRLIELKKKRTDQYIWTISSRLRPEPITDIKIHPNSKPAVLTVYKANDRRNFQVHYPFKFTDFEVTDLDELGPIIQKKKNKISGELMTSLGKRYERLKKIPEELGIQSALLALEQAQSQSSRRKESIWNWSMKSEFLDCSVIELFMKMLTLKPC
ncbi:hypothetical protein Tco_1512114 [Tanacetum coccineum]